MSDPAVPSLADVLAEHMPDRSGDYLVGNVGCECGAEGYVESDDGPIALDDAKTRWWAEHVEAEYWAARRVTTVEQLDALPAEAVVRTTQISGITQSHTWTRRGRARGWQSNGDPVRSETVVQIASRDGLGIDWEPIRVLWLPGEGEQ